VTDLSIVVLTWNTRELVLDCLASIEREILSRRDAGRIEVETIVVDNGSADGTVEAVRRRFPWAELIPLPHNIGFAAGNNAGLRKISGRHAVLLNSDTVVLRDAFEICVRYLDGHPDVGVVGPQLLNPDCSKQNCIHNYPSLVTELVPKPLLESLFPRRFPSKRYEHAGPIDVEAVLGACLFVRREVLDQVGPMPEDYFFFLEETDWCWRIRDAGWRVVHVPEARVVHVHGAATKKKIPARTRIEYHRSLYHFFRKNRGVGPAAAVVALRVVKALSYVLALAPAALFSRDGRERWASAAAVLAWHLRGCPARGGLASAGKEAT
jgi:GT2 family glycosyltransferase